MGKIFSLSFFPYHERRLYMIYEQRFKNKKKRLFSETIQSFQKVMKILSFFDRTQNSMHDLVSCWTRC